MNDRGKVSNFFPQKLYNEITLIKLIAIVFYPYRYTEQNKI